MTDPTHDDVNEILTCLSKNTRLLKELRSGPKYKPELAAVLDVAKSTVYYRFRNLEKHGLVARGPDGYRLTPIGEQLTDVHLDALSKLKSVCEAEPLLANVPQEACPPPDALQGARISVCNGQPEELSTEFREWLLSASEIRGLLPYVSRTFIEQLEPKVRMADVAVELLVAPQTAEYHRNATPDIWRSLLESLSTVVFETVDQPPFGLVIVDKPRSEFTLLAFTDHGHTLGFVRSANECGVDWARDVYETKKSESTQPVTPKTVTNRPNGRFP